MSKVKSIYVCQQCGATSPKWMGRCPHCDSWNSLVEELVSTNSKASAVVGTSGAGKAVLLRDVQSTSTDRIVMADPELNRVLGGGVVPGSLVLIGGEPGIGKSTLLLQVAMQTPGLKVLYVSGEESEQQIKMRAERLAEAQSEVFLYTDTGVEEILRQANQVQPDIMVIDSIQTLQVAAIESAAGSVSQVREATHALQQFAKKNGPAIFIVSHITKEGVIAGPKASGTYGRYGTAVRG
jgi:DNA repair protein RadA/Sms